MLADATTNREKIPRRRHTRLLESFRLCTSVSVICPHFWLIKVFALGVNGRPDLSCASGINPLLLVTVGYGDLSRMKMERVLWPSAQKIRDLAGTRASTSARQTINLEVPANREPAGFSEVIRKVHSNLFLHERRIAAVPWEARASP